MTQIYSMITDQEELLNCQNHPLWTTIPKYILGMGSNVILPPYIEGWVIQSASRGIEIVQENNNDVWLKIGAAENWHDTVLYCVANQYYGLENLALIPGSVGAAPIQNIGAYGVELSHCLDTVNSLNITTGQKRSWTLEDCQLKYRDSCFKHLPHQHNQLITDVTLKLSKTFNPILTYGALTTKFAKSKPSAEELVNAVIELRQKKLPWPKELPNTGSFFKNPIIHSNQLNELVKQYPHLPHYTTPTPDLFKISAAWLIQHCGWKGIRIGDVGTYEHHALVLVNYGTASAQDIIRFAEKIKDSIYESFGIELQQEVTTLNQHATL